MKAMFISLVLLIPRSPASFGVHILSQDLKAKYLFSSSLAPHKKRRQSMSSFSQILTGNKKTCMEKAGMAKATALIKVFRPARDKYLDFQPASFDANLSTKLLKTTTLEENFAERAP